MKMVLAVMLGGGLGALGRYGVGYLALRLLGVGFPYGTLAVNVLGGFFMGVIVELLALRYSASPALQAFLAVGLMGGFTTFSAFSLEVVNLLQSGRAGAAFAYILLSVTLSILALYLGLMAVRTVL